MSEYWVSKKKYFCTYCETYIADDVPSRTHHENGMRHQGNKERFVKGLYKAGEKKRKDEDEERREMKSVEAAAQRAYALDVGAGRGGTGASASSVPAPKAPPPPPPKKPLNLYANYTTAEFLGYKDPDAERIQAKLERKRSQGIAGDWKLVTAAPSSVAPAPSGSVLDNTRDVKPPPDSDAAVVTGMKRTAEAPAIDDDDSRGWKLRKKTARLGEIYDPGVIPIRLKAKKEEDRELSTGGSVAPTNGIALGSANTGSKATDVPKWTKVEWKKPGELDSMSAVTSILSAEDRPIPTEPALPLKDEHEPSSASESTTYLNEQSSSSTTPKAEPSQVKLEDASPSDNPSNGYTGGSFFKKRKGKPLAGAVGRGRRDQV
jgi:WW domain-binding protein 4